MQEKRSIRWNVIKYDKNSSNKEISDILKSRFSKEELLEKSLLDLHDPYLLADMDKAVERIKKSIEKKEKIMIFWDYDVDWVTSTSILMHFFKKIWSISSYRLPHRVEDWYWLKKYFIDEFEKIGVSLVITVDCGTRDIDVVKYAKSLWIDVVVTDHHAVPKEIPKEAVAIINPKREDCNYPFKHLSWAWVAFKLMMALAREFFSEDDYIKYLEESIDIAAIGTVADCMSLTWENRIIVKEWLKQLKNTRSKWIRRLLEDKIEEDLDSDVFGFVIWPRLNAAGRMDTPYKAVNLILNNSSSLEDTIRDIEKLNEKRKECTKVFFDDALENINRDDNIIFYSSSKIEHWIIWIVAWRLTEQFNKPSIVLIDNGDSLVASCRSPEFFSIVEKLEKFKDYFEAFWWHKQAAGFTIKKEKFDSFKSDILKDVNSIDFSNYKKELSIDKLVRLEEIWFNFLENINKYKPYGIWNPKPIFMIEDFNYDKFSFLWQWRDHIRFDVSHGFKIFWFNMWEYYEKIKSSQSIDLIFDLSEDNWQWRRNIMFKVVDIVLN